MELVLIVPFAIIAVLGAFAFAMRRGWIDSDWFEFDWFDDDDFPPTGLAVVTTLIDMGACIE